MLSTCEIKRHSAEEPSPLRILDRELEDQPRADHAVGGGNLLNDLQELGRVQRGGIVVAQLAGQMSREEVKVGLPQQVGDPALEGAREGLVAVDQAALRILHEGHGGTVVDEGPKTLFRLEELLLGQFPF